MLKRPTSTIVLACALALAVVGVVALPPASSVQVVPPGTPLDVASFLPAGASLTGNVDYTAHVQRALDAARGRTLLLPAFPILVNPPPGKTQCLLVNGPVRIVGTPGAELRTATPAVQLLRVQNAASVRLESFQVRGTGGIGRRLAHGLVQLWRCEDVLVRGVTVSDADADGLAIADSSDVRIESCTVVRGSKAGLYLSNCSGAVVAGNVVRDCVGHVASNGLTVGSGILLLSNVDLVCSSNVVVGGVGPGILCGSNDAQRATDGVLIANNRIRGCANVANPATSGGIQLANVQPEHRTHVVVAHNSIRSCGLNGIVVDNHDGAVIQGNVIEDSWMSAISVGHSIGVRIEDNTIVDGNESGASGQAAVYLQAHARGCVARGNLVVSLARPALTPLLDRAPPGTNLTSAP
ncbi:MAG: right-handed parallel beta-helix repeat-containing protein [Planctomycetes bacterium]|nr:right-handed parallel beta-helix repeat-containing protein [Planctomycetota bacterium]